MLYTNLPCAHIDNVVNEAPPTSALRILFLNIMPIKPTTEEDFCRSLACKDIDIELIPIKIPNQQYKCTPQAYVERYYKDFDTLESEHYDGFILTGAPLENIPFEQVRYWKQLTEIIEWAKTHVNTSLYVGWGAQAALYYHFGIPKHPLSVKMFGVFQHDANCNHPLLQHLSPTFPMPHSRHTEVRAEDFTPQCQILATSPESGVGIALSNDGREVYITGHLEYEPLTLHNEYYRDLSKQLQIAPPKYYYTNDDENLGVSYSWQEACQHFFHNWLNFMQTKKNV